MRIDLALKCVQFTFSPLILLQNDLFHKVVDLFIRFLYGISQMLDLLGASDIDLRFFPCLIVLYGIIQLKDRAGYPHGDHAVHKRKHHSHQQDQHHDKVPDVEHPMGKGGIGDHTH